MYWMWANEPTLDDDAIIYGTPKEVSELDLSFDEGLLIGKDVPHINIIQDEESQGRLSNNLIASGTNGLLFDTKLRSLLDQTGITNIQYFPCTIHNTVTGESYDNYQIANIVGKLSCINKEDSDIEYDPDDPDVIEFINALSLNEKAIRGFELLRSEECPQLIIASERIKKSLTDERITGVAFYEPAAFVL